VKNDDVPPQQLYADEWEQKVYLLWPSLVSFLIVRFHVHEADARELVSETFSNFLSTYNCDYEKLCSFSKKYYFTAVRWRYVNHIKSARVRREFSMADEHLSRIARFPDLASRMERDDRREAIRAALETLSEKQRTALLLRYLEDRPVIEVARQLEMTEDAAESLIRRGCGKLRSYFKEKGLSYEEV